MQKILFVDKNFDIGGIQTSMINMINTLSKKFDVYLFLYNPSGPLKDRLNSSVKIIKPHWSLQTYGMSLTKCLKSGTIKQKFFRLFMIVWAKIFNNEMPLRIALKKQGYIGSFDVAIAYHHETKRKSLTSGFNRVLLECTDAKQKISWIHNDCVANPLSEKFNDRYYQKVDKIVCVSEAVKQSFMEKHPLIDKKNIFVCYNFLDFSKIDSYANETPSILFDKDRLVCFSACRLAPVKGFPRAITALSSVIKQHNVMWYIAGAGSDKAKIEETIEKNGLRDNVILIGRQENPYCYIKQADVLVLCSYYEAAPMLYTEAKYFKKPVFTTNISSSSEMLGNGKYGVICNNNVDDMKKVFEELVSDKTIIRKIQKNLNSLDFDEEYFINQFTSIISC